MQPTKIFYNKSEIESLSVQKNSYGAIEINNDEDEPMDVQTNYQGD